MDILAMYADSQPGAAALHAAGRTISFKELNELANRVGNALRSLGAGIGDKVCSVGYNAPEHFVVNSAVTKIAATSVPMNYRLKPPEIAYQIDNSDTVVQFAGPEHVAWVEEARKDAPNLRHVVCWGVASPPDGWLRIEDLIADSSPDPIELPEGATSGTMLYTAGTTGQPKGAYRRSGLQAGGGSSGGLNVFGLKPQTPHLLAGPYYHSAPYAFSNLNLLLGGSVVVMPRFDPEEALQAIDTHKVTWTFMAPTLLTRIVNLPEETKARYDVSSMTTIIVAAAPCPFELKRRVMELFGPSLFEFYGASETGMNTFITPEEHARKPGSCGKVVEGQEIKIRDDEGNECESGVPGEI
ncbi:MAG: AMP-binding protein, partial [Candidatus Binatia bacterium]